MTIGATGALLRVQQVLVERFATFAAGSDGLEATFSHFGLSLPNPAPPLRLYDEPPAGLSSYFRIGDASIDYEHSSAPLWIIDQELEAHVDPVRGRAAVLAMADVLERAFPPTTEGNEPNFSRAHLMFTDADGNTGVAPIAVRDMVPTDARIGYSEGGLTYQAVVTYNLVVVGTD